MKNFQTSISQVYQKILFPYFYHKYLRTHTYGINAIPRTGAEIFQKVVTLTLLKTVQIEWFFPFFFTKFIIFLETTTQYLSKTLSVVKIG